MGNHQLEPVGFTLSCFNYKTRNRRQAWRILGYVKKTTTLGMDDKIELIKDGFKQKKGKNAGRRSGTGSKNQAQSQIQNTDKKFKPELADYHAMLSTIFSDLKKVQSSGGLSWNFPFGLD